MLQKIRFGRAPVILGGILLLLAVIWLSRPNMSMLPSNAYAIQQPTPIKVLEALPELKARPVLLEFRTQTCLDCQALAPLLDKVAKQYPQVTLLVYDLDKTRSRRPTVFDLFQPVTVPTLVGINQQGKVVQAVYERPEEPALNNLFKQLSVDQAP